MKIAYWIDDLEKLRPLGELWLKEQQCERYGIDVSVDEVLDDAKQFLKNQESALIVSMDGDEPVGFLLVFATKSFLGYQKIALEKYWYVSSVSRTSGILLLSEAKKWAREHECSHLIMVASHISSEMYDKVCNFYHHRGMRLLETSYICEV